MPPIIEECGHIWRYGGVKCVDTNPHELSPSLGSEIISREYFDWFYCEKCLENYYKKLKYVSNAAEEIKFNASPK